MRLLPPNLWLILAPLSACTASDVGESSPVESQGGGEDTSSIHDTGSGDADTSDGGASDGDTSDGDTSDTGAAEDEPPWGEGEFSVSGLAFFFDMDDSAAISQITDVEGAEVFVWEAPELRATLSPEDVHAFRIDGIPAGAELTLAIEHPDFVPMLTGILTVDQDLEGITFQTMSQTIGTLATGLLGADVSDPEVCHMATTVTAAGGDDVWAPGEPDATVSLDPVVTAEQGPWYFNTSVIPDSSLDATTTDGGVIVVGVSPGRYTWSGHKDGVSFEQLDMRCEGGWLSNASPPFGLDAVAR